MLRALSRLQVENNQSHNVSVAPNLPPDLQFLIEIVVIIVCEVIKLWCWETANTICNRFLLRNHYHHLHRGNMSRFIPLKNIGKECFYCRPVSTLKWSSTQTFEWEEQRTSNLEHISVAFLLHCITWFHKHLFGLKKWHKNEEKKAEREEEDRANPKDSSFTVRNDKGPLKSSYRNSRKYLIIYLLFRFRSFAAISVTECFEYFRLWRTKVCCASKDWWGFQLGLGDRAVFTYSEPPQQL